MKKALIVNWNKSDEWSGGQETFFSYLSEILNAPQISFSSAAKALNVNLIRQGFDAVFRSRIIEDYLKEYEKIFPLDVIVKNSAIGGYFDLETPIVTVFQDPFDTISKILYFYGYFLESMEHYNACTDLQRKTGEKSACNVAVSKFMQAYMKKIDVKCHKVINEGVSMQKFRPLGKKKILRRKWGIPLDKKVGLSVIKFHPAKGWHILTRLIKEFKDVFWVVCFTEPAPNKAKSKNVRIIQMLPRSQMPEIYNLADFFVLPTCCESFGLSSLEAAACNIPVITQKTGVWWDFWNKRLGIRVKFWEYEPYREAVAKVLENEFSPRKVVEEQFSIQKCGDQWKKLINSV